MYSVVIQIQNGFTVPKKNTINDKWELKEMCRVGQSS